MSGNFFASGMSVGSHRWAHRDWRRINDAQAQQELGDAHRVLSELTGYEVSRVAIPYGSYDRHVLRRLRTAKVTCAYTSDGGRARRDGWLQARTSLRQDLDAEWIAKVLDAAAHTHDLARPHRGPDNQAFAGVTVTHAPSVPLARIAAVIVDLQQRRCAR